MIVNGIRDEKTGKMRLNECRPYTPETGAEDALLHYLHKICNAVEDTEAATSGDIDNAVVQAVHEIGGQITQRLDTIAAELRLIRNERGFNHG